MSFAGPARAVLVRVAPLASVLCLLAASCADGHGAAASPAPSRSSGDGTEARAPAAIAAPAPDDDGSRVAAGRDVQAGARPLPGPRAVPTVERTTLDAPKRVLARVRAWALPGVDGVPLTAQGLACDGDSFWVMANGNLLVRIDRKSGRITRKFDLALGVDEQSHAFGIERVGELIWISVAGSRNWIALIDSERGAVVGTYSSPTTLGPSDLALSEEGVWLADGIGGLFLLDRANASVLWGAKLATPERDYGIAVRADQVAIGNLFGGIWLHRRADLSVVAELVDENGKRMPRERIGTMCFAGDHLVILNERGIEELAID